MTGWASQTKMALAGDRDGRLLPRCLSPCMQWPWHMHADTVTLGTHQDLDVASRCDAIGGCGLPIYGGGNPPAMTGLGWMATCRVTVPGAGVDVSGGTVLGTGGVLWDGVVEVSGLGVVVKGGVVGGAEVLVGGLEVIGAGVVVGGAGVVVEGAELLVGGANVVVGGAKLLVGGTEVLGVGVTEVVGAGVVVGGADELGVLEVVGTGMVVGAAVVVGGADVLVSGVDDDTSGDEEVSNRCLPAAVSAWQAQVPMHVP